MENFESLYSCGWFVACGCWWVCILEEVEADWPKTVSIGLWVWWVLIEEFVFLMEEVVCLWMEGGLCCGTEEGVLGS